MAEGAVAQDKLIGSTLDDRFTIVSLISRGGLSVLYKGVDKNTSQPVTVRVLVTSRSEEEQSQARFKTAVKLMENLRHPNIVSLLGHGITPNGAPYLVLPFVEGRSVREKVDKDGVLSFEAALPIIKDIGFALEYAHRHGIIHRNLKPSNILLTDVGGKETAMLTGFGIAKKAPRDTGDSSMSNTMKVVGSPLYMSPEQFINSKIDVRSDIYSFGCVIHQMLSGVPPFEAPSLIQLMGAHHHQYRSHFDSKLGVPKFVDSVLDAATMKLPANRYASIAQMVTDLESGKCSIDLAEARRHEPAADEENAARQQTIKSAAIITAGSVLVVALVIFIAGFDSFFQSQSRTDIPATPTTSASADNDAQRMLVEGKYSQVAGIMNNQLTLAQAAGERTERLHEKLAMLLYLTNNVPGATEHLNDAIRLRQSIIQAEPDTEEAEQRAMIKDYALIGLMASKTNPPTAIDLVQKNIKGTMIQGPVEYALIRNIMAHYDAIRDTDDKQALVRDFGKSLLDSQIDSSDKAIEKYLVEEINGFDESRR